MQFANSCNTDTTAAEENQPSVRASTSQAIPMEGETVPEARRAASKATRIALGIFVSGTVVLGTTLFLGK